jgi:hypothetical protein
VRDPENSTLPRQTTLGQCAQQSDDASGVCFDPCLRGSGEVLPDDHACEALCRGILSSTTALSRFMGQWHSAAEKASAVVQEAFGDTLTRPIVQEGSPVLKFITMSGALRHAVSRGLANARVSPASAQCRGFAERSEGLMHACRLLDCFCSCFQMAMHVIITPSVHAVLPTLMATLIDAASSNSPSHDTFHRLSMCIVSLLQLRSRRTQRALLGHMARARHLHQARCR